jgi:hypothetical protein
MLCAMFLQEKLDAEIAVREATVKQALTEAEEQKVCTGHARC